jgi:RIO kinase 1
VNVLPSRRERLVESSEREEDDTLWKRSGTGDARKILDEVFDHRTLKAVHKLMNIGHLQTLDFPIATGKEASVFVGLTKRSDEVAVKIYRIGNATFNSIRQYIVDDPRFRSLSHDRRSVIHAWAQKEFKNLMRMHDAGVAVPAPIAYLENILIMEYLCVGDNHDPAPPLRSLRTFDAADVYKQLRRDVRRMVKDGGIVHGDLSEYNIVLVGERPYIIDVSQGVVIEHPGARGFLERDAKNLAHFFERRGIDESAADLFAYWSHGVKFGPRSGHGKSHGREEE